MAFSSSYCALRKRQLTSARDRPQITSHVHSHVDAVVPFRIKPQRSVKMLLERAQVKFASSLSDRQGASIPVVDDGLI